MKSSQDVSSDKTTKTQQKLKQNKKPTSKLSSKRDLQAVIESETPTTSAITEHKKTPSDEEVVDDDNELSSEGAQSQVV